MMAEGNRKKYTPGSDARSEEIFTFPFLVDAKSVKFITDHGRIMFIVRGPPGSGKNTLSSMITDKYPTSVVCSADSYFTQAFVSKQRNKDSLRKSHEYCQKRAKEECEKGSHPVIVKNTHIRAWELEVYLDFAAKYGYTVIMAITVRKFIIDPKVLERTNKKGLGQKYLQKRVSAWEEFVPLYLGWFLCPKDESFVFQQGKLALQSLLEDGKFCKVLGVYCKEEVWNYFKAEKLLFCISSFCNKGRDQEAKKFYLSDKVQDEYGKCFLLDILGFVVSKDYVLAVVKVTSDMKSLMLKKDEGDSLEEMIENMSIQDGFLPELGSSTFASHFPECQTTAQLEDLSADELMNTNYMSFMVVARASRHAPISMNMGKLAKTLFGSIANSNGIIEEHSFGELDDGSKYCRLPDDLWLAPLSKKVTLSSVFTGLYQIRQQKFLTHPPANDDDRLLV